MNTTTQHRTLADEWQAHADKVLPIDCSHAQVMREKRNWYYTRLVELKVQEPSPARDALLAEALGFARAIGTAAEAAQ